MSVAVPPAAVSSVVYATEVGTSPPCDQAVQRPCAERGTAGAAVGAAVAAGARSVGSGGAGEVESVGSGDSESVGAGVAVSVVAGAAASSPCTSSPCGAGTPNAVWACSWSEGGSEPVQAAAAVPPTAIEPTASAPMMSLPPTMVVNSDIRSPLTGDRGGGGVPTPLQP